MSSDATPSEDRGVGAGPGDSHSQNAGEITDDQLPADLVPAEDNPLAEAAEEGESAIDPDIEPGGQRERPYEKHPEDRPARAEDG